LSIEPFVTTSIRANGRRREVLRALIAAASGYYSRACFVSETSRRYEEAARHALFLELRLRTRKEQALNSTVSFIAKVAIGTLTVVATLALAGVLLVAVGVGFVGAIASHAGSRTHSALDDAFRAQDRDLQRRLHLAPPATTLATTTHISRGPIAHTPLAPDDDEQFAGRDTVNPAAP
jgi:hypothetical protein